MSLLTSLGSPALLAMLALATAVTAVASPPASISTAVLVQDSFSHHPVSSSLRNRTPEIGSERWAVQTSNGANALISSDKRIIAAADGTPSGLIEARIALPAPVSAKTSGTITLSARLVTQTSDWIGIGFLAEPRFIQNWNKGGALLWMFIKPSGEWRIHTHGITRAGKLLASGKLSHYDPEKAYTLSLAYKPASGEVRASITDDDVGEIALYPINDGWIDTKLAADVVLEAAGFRANPSQSSKAGQYSIDNFRIDFTQ